MFYGDLIQDWTIWNYLKLKRVLKKGRTKAALKESILIGVIYVKSQPDVYNFYKKQCHVESLKKYSTILPFYSLTVCQT